MGRTNPDAASHQQQSMILVPDRHTRGVDRAVAAGVRLAGPARALRDQLRQRAGARRQPARRGGRRVRDRPGPARPGPHPPLHARASGVAERALALMVDRVQKRIAFGKPLAEQGVVREQIAQSRNEIDQARLLCQKAAWTIDQHGNQSRKHASWCRQIKAVAPQMACNVIDRAIQVHGAAGDQRRHPAGPALRLAPRDAAVRRPRRGAHAHHRARGTRPGEVGFRRGGDALVAVGVGELSGAWNFRDVAEETGIRPGRFFRSSELSQLDDDGPRSSSVGSASPMSPTCARRARWSVAARARCPTASRCTCCRSPNVSAVDGEAPHEAAFQKMMSEKPDDEDVAVAAGRFMTEEYLRFPTLGGAQRAVRQVISLLADGRPVITHCFAGKDRTGFTVATVLEARRCRPRRDHGRLPAQQRGGAAAAGTASWSRSATDPRRPRWSRSPRRG